jgi:ectoine hydroxylase-related dioxygenase (phytanoyl-CoA dioxygenase family)
MWWEETGMLSREQINGFHEHGFLAVEGVLPRDLVEQARAVVDDFVEQSRGITEHTAVFDLEPGHTPASPRVRRLKEPCAIHPIFDQISRTDAILDIVADLIGPAIRYQGSKLNMKAAEYGAPVEWHQDFAFYPHTNDDLLAVGVALDDCTRENGCLLMIPGSHHGPILDHHQEGVFVGAVDVERERVDASRAVPVTVRAGGITLHHCRMLHASAPNTSPLPRRLLLLQLAAVDAWPVMGVADLAKFDSWVLRGQPTARYRVAEMDIRIPLPKHERQGSIYEIQTAFRPKVFAGARS